MASPIFSRSYASSVSEAETTVKLSDRRYELPAEGSSFASSMISLSTHSPSTPPRSLSWRRVEPVSGSSLSSSEEFCLQGLREFERKNFGRALSLFRSCNKLEPSADKNLLCIVGLIQGLLMKKI